MKKTYTGWVRNSDDNADVMYWDGPGGCENLEGDISVIYKTKGRKKDWSPGDWPPRKIKITIEVD